MGSLAGASVRHPCPLTPSDRLNRASRRLRPFEGQFWGWSPPTQRPLGRHIAKY